VIVRKSSLVYCWILSVAFLLIALAFYSSAGAVNDAVAAGPLTGLLALCSLAFIAYFWLNGTKDVVYTLYYHARMKAHSTHVPRREDDDAPNIVMVYCTFNDFNATSLQASMDQAYENYSVVILDDSSDPAYRTRVDEFASEHGIQVVRRDNRQGFKAGNLNNYLQSMPDWDYFVILDSDEIVPPVFIDRALDYFAAHGDVGIVQANHRATRQRNPFMSRFSIGVDSHWNTYQVVKDRFGFMSLLGHGAMVSRECFAATGGFPHVVAEDICLSIEARNKGFVTVFAQDIVCEEEFPVDFLAFKKRHNKWTQGNMEFIRNYTGTILRSDMRWFEKLDIVLFTYALPLTSLFSMYVLINVIVFPLLGYRFALPLWMLAPTIVFLFAPMLNDILYYSAKLGYRRLGHYLLQSTLLYGAMYSTSLRASIKSMFGSSTFIVTPKEDTKISLREAIQLNRVELIAGIVVALVAIRLTGSILPVMLLVTPAIFAMYLSVIHQE
jgi:cellulose synthase/poly-beta-1,6-N-acetylglucosamine synthase-like glycosyltransferase